MTVRKLDTAQRAVSAATEVAYHLGRRSDDPVVLADSSNVLVHLRPEPLVARVATASALIRPGVHRWLAREIELARFLHDRGFPVATPAPDPLAGPHRQGGFDITFWNLLRHETHDRPSVAVVGPMLARLHAVLRDFPGDLTGAGPLSDIRHLLDAAEHRKLLTGGDLTRLRNQADEFDAALARCTATQPLHGDAHQGNLLRTPDGPVWIDFEDTWRGPIAWDVASMADTGSLHGHSLEAVAAYPDPVPDQDLAVCHGLRAMFGLCWRFLMVLHFHKGEDAAREALRTWFNKTA